MSALAWVRGRMETLGLPGVMGVTLLAFALGTYFSAVVPAWQELEELQRRVERTATPVARDADGVRLAIARGVDQLERFNKNFRPLSDAPALLLKLHEIAAQNRILLHAGEYQLTSERELGLTRYHVTLPLSGTYWQVRLFVAQALDELEGSALEEISMRRESVVSGAVETRVRLVFFFGDAR